jgi:hypothetical protein
LDLALPAKWIRLIARTIHHSEGVFFTFRGSFHLDLAPLYQIFPISTKSKILVGTKLYSEYLLSFNNFRKPGSDERKGEIISREKNQVRIIPWETFP